MAAGTSENTNLKMLVLRLSCCRYGADEELPVDYAFLDEDEEFDYNSVDGFLGADGFMRRKRSADCDECLQTGLHVVYKRRDVGEDSHGDYSEFIFLTVSRISTDGLAVIGTIIFISLKVLLTAN